MNRPLETIEHVYIVDDDDIDQYLIKRSVKKLIPNTQIKTFSSAELFLEFVDSSIQSSTESALHNSLVTMDLCMPGMGGIEALKEIQNRFEEKHLSENTIDFYVLTSSNNPKDRAEIDSFSFVYCYANKPLTVDLLKEIVFEKK